MEFLKKFLNFFLKRNNLVFKLKVKKTKLVFEDFYFFYTKKFFGWKKGDFIFVNGKFFPNDHPKRLIFFKNTWLSSVFVFHNYQNIDLASVKNIYFCKHFTFDAVKNYLSKTRNFIFFNQQIIFYQKIKKYLNKKNVYFFQNKKFFWKKLRLNYLDTQQLLTLFLEEKKQFLLILGNTDYFELTKLGVNLSKQILFIFDSEIFCNNGYCNGCVISMCGKNFKVCKTNLIKTNSKKLLK